MHILHVEDNPVDVDLVARALANASPPVSIDAVGTLNDARELLINPERYDAALVDLRLPDGSGLELVAEIRERGLPIALVMLTGFGDPHAAIAALQSGADDYLPKSMDAYERLFATLSAACQRSGDNHRMRKTNLRVLYAEHNVADIDLTRRHLERHTPFIRLTVVPDVAVALSYLPLDSAQDSDFDVLLLDYRLPGLDALDAVGIIRNERGLAIPIVIVSGQGSEEVAARAIQLGVEDYVSKHPGYLYELAPTLEKVHRQALLAQERQELQRTSQQMSYLLEASPVLLYTLEVAGDNVTPTWVSGNVSRLFGFSEQEALAEGWWAAGVHPEDRDRLASEMGLMSSRLHGVHVYRFYDKLGRMHWIRDELRRLPGEEADRFTILGAWQDITAERQAEQVQAARMAALDSLLNGAPLEQVLSNVSARLAVICPEMRISILLVDPESGRLFTATAAGLPGFYNEAIDGLQPAVGAGSCGTAAATGELVIVEDVMTHPYWQDYQDLASRAGFRACWSMPFRNGRGEVSGTFAIYHPDVRTPDENERQLISEFAQIAGIAVQRAHADAHLRQAAAVFESTREGVVITDLTPRITAVNPAYSEITGYAEADVIGCNPSILQSGRQDESFYQALWSSVLETGYWQGEIWNRRRNGEIYPQLLAISTVRDDEGVPKYYVGVMTDITQIRKSEANLERLAHYDPLTALPNRLLTQSRLEHAVKRARRDRRLLAVLFIDLDRFKNVNDSLGHPSGDTLLQLLTERIAERLRDEDTFGRLGGDEFLVVLSDIHVPEDAVNIGHEILRLLEMPFHLEQGREVYIGASIGVSLFPQDADEADQLVQRADAAMSQAKVQGRNNLRCYTPDLTEAVDDRVARETRLRRALSRKEFLLHYQPQVEISSGRVVGCEALLRWQDPDRGMIAPSEFVPLAEDTGLIVPLGTWVLRAAFAQFEAWLDRVPAPFCMAINLSAQQLRQPDIVEIIADAFHAHRLSPGQIKLELTESMLMGRGDDTVELLERLKALGVKLSIDDFGTGYSSLAYLKRFPIDELKIDRGFVLDIPHDQNDAEIAVTIIAMARNLNLRVVAEGVETPQQAAFLLEHGCESGQGFLYHRPMAPEVFAETCLPGQIRDTLD